MPDHTQPTKEELEANLQKNLEELDKPEVEEVQEEVPQEEVQVEETPQEEVVEPEEVKLEEVPQEEPAKQQPPTTEERYKESTKEAQRLYKNNVEMNQAIKEANALPDPTEQELVTEYPEWEDMSDVEKRLAKDTLINKRFRDHINTASSAQRNVDEWVDRVEKFTDDPKTMIDFPDLEGKAAKFKEYAANKKLVGTDFGVLVGGFLYEQQKQRVVNKGKMLETGTGGDKVLNKTPEKISLEEAAKIRNSDYRKYKQLLQEGKISTDIG